MCVCGGGPCVLCFRPREQSLSYDSTEDSHLQLCLKRLGIKLCVAKMSDNM